MFIIFELYRFKVGAFLRHSVHMILHNTMKAMLQMFFLISLQEHT